MRATRTGHPTGRARIHIAIALAVAGALLETPRARAVDRTWLGANSPTGTSTALDVNDPAKWSTGVVPGAGDKAIFTFTKDDGVNVDIPTSASLFVPDSLVLNGGTSTRALSINKDLILTSLTASGSGTSANSFLNRLLISTTRNTTLELTGSNPIDVTGAASWRTINAGSNSFYTTFNLSGSSILFKTLNTSPAPTIDKNVSAISGIQGGQTIQTAITGNPQMNFTAPTGTITLQTASSRPEGTLGLGFTQMGVYSTQTWAYTPDALGGNTSYIRMAWRQGSGATAGPELIRSLDVGGARLDNLGAVNIVLDAGNVNLTTNSDATTGMRVAGGTYGSLNWIAERANDFNTFLKLNGDVTFSGNAVQPGFFNDNTTANRTPAFTTPYGLIIRGGDFSGTNAFYSKKKLDLNGKTLTVTNGVLLDDRSLTGGSNTKRGFAEIDASGATMNVAGDFVINSVGQGGSSTNFATQTMGVYGNSSTIVNLGGNYTTNVVSLSGAGVTQGLSAATINMVGGSSLVKTYEVAAWSSQTLFNTGYAIGTFNVGTAITAGKAKLVNDQLNDDASITLAHDGNRTGEKLMVSALNIAANSKLDVNAQVVNLGIGSLTINSTGVLDLDTGLVLNIDDLVPTFVGIGDQTATWNLSAARVMDSTNPTLLGFLAVTSGGNTVWQAVPEPTALSVVGVVGLGASLRRKKRRN